MIGVLTVNVSKSKVLIFNKSGRCLNGSYSIQNQALECVSSYKYLGVIFSASGSFRQTQNDLYKKGLKALFMLKNFFNCFTSRHIYKHACFWPHYQTNFIIWQWMLGSFRGNFCYQNFCNFTSLSNKFEFEKLHIMYSKYSIGFIEEAQILPSCPN